MKLQAESDVVRITAPPASGMRVEDTDDTTGCCASSALASIAANVAATRLVVRGVRTRTEEAKSSVVGTTAGNG